MRPRGQIHQKLKQVRFRHLKKELSRLLRRAPTNCEHNQQVGPDKLGVCSLDCKVCDGQQGDRAPQCAVFSPRYEKEGVKDSLNAFFDNRPIHEISVLFPDLAALAWVLRDEGLEEIEPLTDQELLHLDGVPLWADTPEQREILKENLGFLQARSDALDSLAERLSCDVDLESIWDELRERETNQEVRIKQTELNLERALEQLEVVREANQAIVKDREAERLAYKKAQEVYEKAIKSQALKVSTAIKPVEKKTWWRFWQ